MATRKVNKEKKDATRKKITKKKDGLIIVPSPVAPDMQVVIASEQFDDEMIEKELMGEIMPYYIYQFEQDGKSVVGLTVKGVNEVVRRLNKDPRSGSKIRINPESLKKEEVEREGQKGIEVTVYAEDLVTGNSAFGVKFEAYKKVGRNGEYHNKFAVEKALSKAERNARRKLISEVVATKIIQKIIKAEPDTVQQIDAPRGEMTRKIPAKVVPTDPNQIVVLILESLDRMKEVGKIIEFDEKAQSDKRFSATQKNQIHDHAIKRVNEIESGKAN